MLGNLFYKWYRRYRKNIPTACRPPNCPGVERAGIQTALLLLPLRPLSLLPSQSDPLPLRVPPQKPLSSNPRNQRLKPAQISPPSSWNQWLFSLITFMEADVLYCNTTPVFLSLIDSSFSCPNWQVVETDPSLFSSPLMAGCFCSKRGRTQAGIFSDFPTAKPGRKPHLSYHLPRWPFP